MGKRFQITFKNIDEIRDFVNQASRYPQAMDLSRGRYMVDAKSILGVLKLGLQTEVSLTIHGDMTDSLEDLIDSYAIA